MSKKSEFVIDNWRLILLFAAMLVTVPLFIYHFATMDKGLKDNNLRRQTKVELDKEMKELVLPPKTAVNNFQSSEKSFSILVQTRYRTELSETEFVDHFKAELEKRNWRYYDKDGQRMLFCRGKQDASLSGEGTPFSDSSGRYFSLSFSKGLEFNNNRPKNCW